MLVWTDSDALSISFFDISRNDLSKHYASTLKYFAIKIPIGIAFDHGMSEPYGRYTECYGNGRCLGLAGMTFLNTFTYISMLLLYHNFYYVR